MSNRDKLYSSGNCIEYPITAYEIKDLKKNAYVYMHKRTTFAVHLKLTKRYKSTILQV